ncbi:periplasmic chaperone for outer membrane proteins Skp [Salegentibacter holothuriorum]|uniref:Periplasmic chaperone for outer membrane proteins Skp n=1 Tax=Salegentibacter holothuriorum TaxID=241145 RepID=A0A1T5BGZ0_9FLAO|nr:OmpH family outer membrane protein [Salegentibacter holothuriorum]SKB46561.1 periplasmic chaperone for outer membrane proteins Skp [Salegentibacter holothuriorum]
MLKRTSLFTLFILIGLGANAQKPINIGFVDMEYILENVPEYQQASTQLDQRVKEWQNEIEQKRNEIAEMKTNLQNERALLTPELIEEREEEIAYQQEQATNYEQKRFGPKGDYMIQKRQLIKPIQDQVFTAVQEIAETRDFDFIFDRNAESGMLFAKNRFDLSEQVLRSINRASNRRQIETKQEELELERAEARTAEEDKELSEREKAIQDRKNEREALIEERRRKQDSIKEARQKEFEQRRERILKERQQKRDSIEAARKRKDTIN